MTRDDLVRLGQAARPWDFLPFAAKAIDQIPDDLALRFVTAANLARLGLRTLAQEQLDSLPAQVQADADVVTLRGAVAGLPEDRLTSRRRLEVASANVAALGQRGIDLPVGLWQGTIDQTEFFRTLDGAIVRRQAAAKGLSACSGLFNQTGAAEQFIATSKADPNTDLSRVILEGIDPPALLQALYRAAAPTSVGYQPRLYVLQADPCEFLDALSLTDLRPILRDGRVEFYVGPDAGQRLLAVLRSRIEFSLPTLVVPASTCRTRCTPPTDQVLGQALQEQHHEFERLTARIEAAYQARTQEYWRRRYQEALSGGPPLRVLVPTSRYTTYVQHAASDLVQTLKAMDCTAEILIEPDDNSQISSIVYQRALDRLDPDLVILINYPRRSLGNVFPANVPYVCWVQDAMPHLFDRALGAAQTNLDFLVGHTFPDLFEKYGYPPERLLPISLVADERKFHPAPVPSALREKHACDIAFVSHHSETPEGMYTRLAAEMQSSPAVQRTLVSLWPDIQRVAAEATTQYHTPKLLSLATSRLRDTLGRDADQKTITLLMKTAMGPLVDRILRHEALAWAAELAEERGYRLHIYGRGWEKHPRFGAYAKGELPHGDELRACYQSASVHLHVSGNSLVHQRVVECYLSGGLCLCRMHADALAGPRTTVQLALAHCEPDAVDTAKGLIGYTVANHPEAMALAAQLGRIGYPLHDQYLWTSEQRRFNQRRLASALAIDHDAAWLLGDLEQTTFTTRQQLGELVERARERPVWRQGVVDMVARTARSRLTHKVFAERVISVVSRSLGVTALREAV